MHSMTNLNWICNKGKAVGEVSHSQCSKPPDSFLSSHTIIARGRLARTFWSLPRGSQSQYVWYHNHCAGEYDPASAHTMEHTCSLDTISMLKRRYCFKKRVWLGLRVTSPGLLNNLMADYNIQRSGKGARGYLLGSLLHSYPLPIRKFALLPK